MSIYKRRHAGKRSRYFTAEFTFHGKLYRRGGFVDRDHAKDWLATESNKLRRGETGYVKPMLRAQVAPLVTSFIDYLRGRGRDEMYCYTSEKRLTRLLGDCGWLTLGHVNAASLERWRDGEQCWRKQAIGPRTKNQYLDIARQFGKWLRKPAGKLSGNPLADVENLRASDNPAFRRAGKVEEIDRLLATCPKERRTFYLFLIYCPLRMKTIRQLTWKMLHLDGTPPWVEIPAALNKSRHAEKSPLRHDVAAELRKAKKRAKADDLVFPTVRRVLGDFKTDLAAAGVAFDDGKGSRRLDRHAMRKTLIRWGKVAGVSVDALSLILHHRDSRTTKRHYDDDAVDPILNDVLERLPTVGKVRSA